MGYYGCNFASIQRTTEDGEAVIVATVIIDDLGGKEVRHVVKGTKENAVKVAAAWVIEKMSEVCM